MRTPFFRTKYSDLENRGDSPTDRPGDPFAPAEEDGIAGLSELYSPDDSCEARVRDIADILLEDGKLSDEAFTRARQLQSDNPSADLAALLIDAHLAPREEVLKAKACLYDMQFRRIGPDDVEAAAFEKLDTDTIRNLSVMPVAVEGDTLLVATSEPGNIFAIESVRNKTRMPLRVVVCCPEDIEAACGRFKTDTTEYDVDDIISDMTDVEVVQDQDKDFAEDLEKMAGQSPVIKFVNYLISNAIREGASDIHIEPKEKHTKIRYRIDGVLFEAMQSPPKMHPAIVSRIKVMANLDISERRLPQDGKVSVIVASREVDLRVSTLPTSMGEKVVIRVLDSQSILRGLNQLGMEPDTCAEFEKQVALPHGILLVTGPTGSGKSTTLYSALAQMDGERLNVSTVEDPVEYKLEFCNQVQANEKIGLTFASALRSLLRQDPDVIMIGEIRDHETAKIAVQAALTGHLVLSTLHTNDAAASVTRLVNIGIDPYLIAASLNAVLAQRLVRRICPKCRQKAAPAEALRPVLEAAALDPAEIVRGAGCEACRSSGYSGRLGIYELLVVDDPFRDMINADPSVKSMRRAFRRSGRASLFDDGMHKVAQGLTTVDEVLRVTQAHGAADDESTKTDTVT